MTHKKLLIPFLVVMILVAGINPVVKAQNENNFEISKNLEIFISLYNELNKNYVDEINPGELMVEGIESMLATLDPYTVYIPESQIEDYRMITTGQYGGIGSLIHKNGNYVVISEPYEGFPAQRSGLKAGDRVLSINGEDMVDKPSDEVSKFLKGQPGTTVTLVVERDGTDAPLAFEIERENIKIKDIPYYGMLDDNIAYIKLTGFTQQAGAMVKDAYLDLKNNYKVEGVILDLRNNGGGLLAEAVNVTNIFVDKGELVVSTKGRLEDRNKEHHTRFSAIDTKVPLVVLVNPQSASASEIVAGAIQDMDRGIILGQRSFGKGLVQNVVPLSYNSQMKITVAKYYIPSGRCIQAIDYSHKDEDGYFTKIPDSLVNEFKTKKGRVVYDGGGIDPDIKMGPVKYSRILTSLFTKFLIFDYATKFVREHPDIPAPEEFTITDEIYSDFVAFLSDKEYDYTTACEEKLDELKESATKEGSFDAIEEQFLSLQKAMKHSKEEDLVTHKEEISKLLKMEIVSRYYYQEGKIRASLDFDPEIKRAIEILEDPATYKSILDGSYSKEKAEKDIDDKEQG
ncbi:MAG: S41 family peptidase [Bacteroidales bacterium]|jgi:carboxyl-terminal processing protease|nr:S41 family peptidase [Bacteroidales bacterium]